MPKILFLTLHRRDRSPGQRFRHEQYLTYLTENGFSFTFSNLLSEQQDRVFYGKGNVIAKFLIGLSCLFKRLRNVVRAGDFDIIFMYRDAFFFGTFLEFLFKQSGAKLIFDFDDSIWLMDENPNQGIFNKLKNPLKTNKILGFCDLVIAGNQYLADHARQFIEKVMVIPTTIDTDEFLPKEKTSSSQVVIGWSGSFSTVKHFRTILPVLEKLKTRFHDQISFTLIGDADFEYETLGIRGKAWSKETELLELAKIDIGIMPLPDDQWSRGKCGFKGLLYMSLGIPAVLSPVGVNSKIIQDGENGYLASHEEEWVDKLSRLIEDPQLRNKLGEAGRKTVVENYSVSANREKWLHAFESVLY